MISYGPYLAIGRLLRAVTLVQKLSSVCIVQSGNRQLLYTEYISVAGDSDGQVGNATVDGQAAVHRFWIYPPQKKD